MVTTYDQASYNLAAYFLASQPCGSTETQREEFCRDLARHIQQAVEDWFNDNDT